MYKVAFGSIPKDGGTFTFYSNLRPALLRHGIDLRCVTVGKREAGLIERAYVDDGCVLLAANTHNVKKQSMAFSNWCDQEQVDLVLAINSVAILSALPYLPKRIRILSRCANAFDEGYRVTMSGRKRLMRIIALTPRLQKDLIDQYGADPAMIQLVPNGIDPDPFKGQAQRLGSVPFVKSEHKQSKLVQLGFMGRLEHRQKGVLYLPKILRRLKQLEVSFRLRIAGKGIHRSILEKELRSYITSGEVEFLGAISKDEVPAFLTSVDVFLFTSHFEGCPNALLEAMMAGCAPVAFLIDGITDFVLEHGKTGFIAPMSDCTAFAGYIERLARDRQLLETMGRSASSEAHRRFVPEVAAERYAAIFHEVMKEPLPDYEPLPWSAFQIDPIYRKRWKTYVPAALTRFGKRFLNQWQAQRLWASRHFGGDRLPSDP